MHNLDTTHTQRRPRPYLACLLSLALLAGCASAPPTRSLVVIPSLPLAQPGWQQQAVASATVELGQVRLPEYWQHRSVRYTDAQGSVVGWPSSAWAERVEVGVTRRLAQALQQAMGHTAFIAGPGEPARVRLLVDVRQLDIAPAAQRLDADVYWQIILPNGQRLSNGRLTSAWPVQVRNAEEQAQSISQWLDELSERLAPALRASLATP